MAVCEQAVRTHILWHMLQGEQDVVVMDCAGTVGLKQVHNIVVCTTQEVLG